MKWKYAAAPYAHIVVTFLIGCSLWVFFRVSHVDTSYGTAQSNTSRVSASLQPIEGYQGREVRLLFGGDVMFDRYIRTQADRYGKESVLSHIDPILRSADLVIVNLEGPITSHPSKSVGSATSESRHFSFTFDPEWARVLSAHNIRLVNIGNNHILNFGEAGLSETREFLRDAGISFFGDPLDERTRTFIERERGKKIGFVNYNQFYRDGESRAIEDVRKLRPLVDVLFVYAHWGTEYIPETSDEKRLAHSFIDHGADAVIGSHPHVVQGREVYNGKTIYYSLGNLVFDQYFSQDVSRGLLVEISIASDDTLSFREIPIKLQSTGETRADDVR